MRRALHARDVWSGITVLAIAIACGTASLLAQRTNAPRSTSGWTIPADAAALKSEGRVSRPVVNYGKTLYRLHCQRCHGPVGRGDGTEADPKYPPGDLSDRTRAPANADGVMFYKIWFGRSLPPMPAYKDQLTKDEVWAVVHYVKTLRK
jgi:mono/diheme cytochrome c family protein